MKKILKAIPVLIFVFTVGTAIGIKAQTDRISDKIVRFHIVADGNSDEAQRVKWEIREKIFENIDFENINSKENALKYFKSQKENIRKIANAVLRENKLSYVSSVYIGKKQFPVREYDSFVLPAGIYDTVSVILGSGEGENFFCVMYPSVCSVSSVTEKTDCSTEMLGSVLSEKETDIVTNTGNKTIIKFKLAEMLNNFLTN